MVVSMELSAVESISTDSFRCKAARTDWWTDAASRALRSPSRRTESADLPGMEPMRVVSFLRTTVAPNEKRMPLLGYARLLHDRY